MQVFTRIHSPSCMATVQLWPGGPSEKGNPATKGGTTARENKGRSEKPVLSSRWVEEAEGRAGQVAWLQEQE